MRLKFLADVVAGQSPPSEDVADLVGGTPFLQGNAEFGKRFPDPKWQVVNPPKRAKEGDILISVRAPVGALNIADRSFGIGRGLAAVRAVKCDRRFLWWWFHTQVDLLDSESTGTTFKAIVAADLRNLEFPSIGLDEQRAIADYLDQETAQIDALVAKQEEFIGLLRERRDAIADSEFQRTDGRTSATIRQTLIRLERAADPGSGVVTAYRDGKVTLRENRRTDGYTMSAAEAGYQGVLAGDIVFHALDGFAGAVGISDSEGQCSPVYHVCRPRYEDDAEYLALLIRYLATSGFLSTQAPSTRQRSVDFRNWGKFARVPLRLPSVEHQKAFVAEFRERAAHIDALVTKAEEHIALAKERRAALITAAVTGQFDVRTVRKAG